ncbi:MAG: DNA primase [Victivallales bacterium]|nr:DNA primase [Victivallales bacterium]
MNRAVPEEIIEEIRSRIDIVDLIGSYIPVKRAGATFKACCPFHQEKTPSFVITPQRQRYHCFGCGKGGDVFRFVMEHEGVDFPAAIHMLAGRCGVIIPERQYSSPQEAQEAKVVRNRKERLYELHEAVSKFYAANLRNEPQSPVSLYFAGRGIPAELAEKFGIGAAPDGWQTTMDWCSKQGFTVDEMLDGGIILASENKPGSYYDRFRNRLVFPIWNEQGRVVAFSARTVEADSGGAKYVNSPETMIFRKSHVLYALPLARQAIQQYGFFIMCEGQLDTIAMHQAGFANAVAPQGTAFTNEQARILRRYSDRAYICFDSDSAGIKATLRAFDILLPLDFEVKVIILPGNSDPDELLKTQGEEAVKAAVNNAVDFFDFLYRHKVAEHDVSTPGGKTRIVADFITYLQKLSNSVMRSLYAARLSSLLGINEEAVFRELNKYRKKEKFAASRKQLMTQESLPTGDAHEGTANDVSGAANNAMELLPPEIVHAEKTLLPLAIAEEAVAQRLSAELPAGQISETALGRAINEVIKLTMQGEWHSVLQHLNDWERENPDPVLSSILADAVDFKKKYIAKATDDCIATIRNYYRDRRKEDILNSMRTTTDPEERLALLKELMSV